MGTDVHMAAEVRNDEGEWEFVPGPIVDCMICCGTGFRGTWDHDTRVYVPSTEACRWCTSRPEDADDPYDRAYLSRTFVGPGKHRDTWYSDRNYVVFAILGNVRNGEGFAGVYTHDPLPFISDCRGVPDDVTEATLSVLSNEHSATWCTLAEIMDYDWHAPIHRGGVLTLEHYELCRRTGAPPTSWCGAISGQGVITVSPSKADAHLAGQVEPTGREVYVNYEWDDTLDEWTAAFLDRMKMLAMQAGEHECRLVMDFDS